MFVVLVCAACADFLAPVVETRPRTGVAASARGADVEAPATADDAGCV
jgi:hypothetical protein